MKWKLALRVLPALVVLWLAEPYIREWYYKEECSFGSVSKEKYAEIRKKASEISRNWDWGKKAYQAPDIIEKSASATIYSPHLTTFIDANLDKFIPEAGSTDVKIAYALAFMEGIGARMYLKNGPKSYKGQRPVIELWYVIYKMKLKQYGPILFTPKSRFVKIYLELQMQTAGTSIVKNFKTWPTGFFMIPLDDGGEWTLFNPLGCVNEGLFKHWGISW